MNTDDTQNPLTIRTANEGAASSFMVPTLATNHQDRQEHRNTVAFDTRMSTVNQWLMNLAHNTDAVTTATNREDRPKNRQQGPTNHVENQYYRGDREENHQAGTYFQRQSNTYVNRSWENNTHHTCNYCGERGHIAKDCTKSNLECEWYHTRTHSTAACRSKPRSTSTPLESPSGGNYHPTQSPRQHNNSIQPPVPNHITQPSPAPS